MISVGLDVSKGKSTVCILKHYGEIISIPFNVNHVEKKLSNLVDMIKKQTVKSRLSWKQLESITYLFSSIFLTKVFVSIINPLILKKYSSIVLRKGKTDKLDAIKILTMELIIGSG